MYDSGVSMHSNGVCLTLQKRIFKNGKYGLPRRLSGKESACQCRRLWLDLWSGKIPHAAEQLSPCMCTQSLHHVWLFVALWTVGCQAPLSTKFSRQEHWNGLPFLSPGDLLNRGSNCISCDSCIGRGILDHWVIWDATCHNYTACALEPGSRNYWSLHTYSLCSTTREATAMRSLPPEPESSPGSPQLQKTCAATKTQHSQK